MMFWIIGIVAVAGLIGIFVVKGYNSLVVIKNRVENQAVQIDVQLKRRADLIPNILEVTKGYARYEQETLKSVTQLRTQILSAEDITTSYQASEKQVSFTMILLQNTMMPLWFFLIPFLPGCLVFTGPRF